MASQVDDESQIPSRAATEHSPLLTDHAPATASEANSNPPQVVEVESSAAALISLLLMGVFIANADTSLVLATNTTISSSFSALSLAPWLTTAYLMAVCCAQPVVGKLSSVFTRKSVLLSCYAIFSVGSFICGIGQSMGQVIAGRAIAGLGGAGMTVVVSILITDLVGIREVAQWRSYVNIFATTGRMIGGPIGGWLADSVGWRWSFLGQVPVILIAMILVWWRLDASVGRSGDDSKDNTKAKIAKIDFVGAIVLSASTVSFLLAVDGLGKATKASLLTTNLPAILVSIALIVVFLYYESYYAKSPIFPPRLFLYRSVWTSYVLAVMQNAAQIALMFSVPLYFQVVFSSSNTEAGFHLLPAFVGNTIGSLATGWYIKSSGRYKTVTILGAVIGAAGYIAIIVRWHGVISFWDTLEVGPGGFAMGVVSASAFIALTAGLEHKDVAVATGGFYLAGNLGSVLGVGISNGIQRAALGWLLGKRLDGEGQAKLIEHVLQDVQYVQKLKGQVRETVVMAYVESLEFSHGLSLGCSILAILIGLCIREYRLR